MLGRIFLPVSRVRSFRARLVVSVAATLLLMASGLILALVGQEANRAEAALERTRVTGQIRLIGAGAKTRLEAMARAQSPRDDAPAPPGTARQADFDRLITVKLTPRTAGSDTALQSAVAAILSADARSSIGGGMEDVTGAIGQPADDIAPFVMQESTLYAVNAARMEGGAEPIALVGLQKVDDIYLSGLSRAAGTRPIQVLADAAANPGNMMLALNGPADARSPALSWQPDRPGDLMMMRGGLVLAIAAMVVAFALLWQARSAIRELNRSEEHARKLTGFDLLSGLPNRFLFSQLLDQACINAARGNTGFALLYFDIDRFREINELLGHDAGDTVIVAVAERINAMLRPGDRLARFGGDEFAILQAGNTGPGDAEDLARRIMTAARAPVDVGGRALDVRLSGGLALYPQDAATRQEMMRCADEALTSAKRDGRDRFGFFLKRHGDDMRSRKATEDELRHAIETSGLSVYYQPIMTVDGGKIACVEALVRWPHPVRGMVAPDHFISLAEDRGLILPLGEFVLRQACRDARHWNGLRVAVNVSPIQFRQADFARTVERILTEEAFDAAQLEIELTEGVVIADADQAENIIMDLRALGCRVALDDFGTGYSSLVYLRRFAFDKIKIDRSFLEAMEGTGESAIIVHSIIHLGRQLGLTVTAEGIETREQQRFLQAAGAHELQGYLFSKPVTAAEIGEMLAEEATRSAGKPTPKLSSMG